MSPKCRLLVYYFQDRELIADSHTFDVSMETKNKVKVFVYSLVFFVRSVVCLSFFFVRSFFRFFRCSFIRLLPVIFRPCSISFCLSSKVTVD